MVVSRCRCPEECLYGREVCYGKRLAAPVLTPMSWRGPVHAMSFNSHTIRTLLNRRCSSRTEGRHMGEKQMRGA